MGTIVTFRVLHWFVSTFTLPCITQLPVLKNGKPFLSLGIEGDVPNFTFLCVLCSVRSQKSENDFFCDSYATVLSKLTRVARGLSWRLVTYVQVLSVYLFSAFVLYKLQSF